MLALKAEDVGLLEEGLGGIESESAPGVISSAKGRTGLLDCPGDDGADEVELQEHRQRQRAS